HLAHLDKCNCIVALEAQKMNLSSTLKKVKLIQITTLDKKTQYRASVSIAFL
ncbi:hypothetical protein ACJX0J_022297, partial [Zea mays]